MSDHRRLNSDVDHFDLTKFFIIRKMEDTANTGSTAVENTAEVAKTATKPSPKKAAAKAKPKAKSTHPATSEMVTAAIRELKDRKGSSLQAIKKYIVSTYKVDSEKVTPFIKRYLKAAVSSGSVVQTKGKGASGSFKLSTAKPTGTVKRRPQRSPKEKKPAEKSAEKKTTAVKAASPKKPKAPKKAGTPKKAAAEKKAKASPPKTAARAGAKTAAAANAAAAAMAASATPEKKSAKKVTAAKNISKTKKIAKAPAAKTRTPKPKKATTSKAAPKK